MRKLVVNETVHLDDSIALVQVDVHSIHRHEIVKSTSDAFPHAIIKGVQRLRRCRRSSGNDHCFNSQSGDFSQQVEILARRLASPRIDKQQGVACKHGRQYVVDVVAKMPPPSSLPDRLQVTTTFGARK